MIGLFSASSADAMAPGTSSGLFYGVLRACHRNPSHQIFRYMCVRAGMDFLSSSGPSVSCLSGNGSTGRAAEIEWPSACLKRPARARGKTKIYMTIYRYVALIIILAEEVMLDKNSVKTHPHEILCCGVHLQRYAKQIPWILKGN